MRILDLFSCVGCHTLGTTRAGHQTVALCESNPWRRRVLAKIAKGIPINEDVHTFSPPKADVCFGGPPCQATSVASAVHGYRSGGTFWPAMFRCGLDARAEWFVVEQPPGNAAWEIQVSRDLSNAGFHVGRLEFAACDVGAPYLRRRVFMVAGPGLQRLALAWAAIPSAIDRAKRAATARGDWNPDTIPAFGMDTWRSEGVDERRQRIEALGDSNPPAMAEAIGYILAAAA